MHAYHMHACFCLFPNKLSSWVICNDVQKLTSLKSSKQTGPKLFLTLDSAFCTYICSLITRIFLLIICKRYVGLLAPFFTKNICKDIYIYIYAHSKWSVATIYLYLSFQTLIWEIDRWIKNIVTLNLFNNFIIKKYLFI